MPYVLGILWIDSVGQNSSLDLQLLPAVNAMHCSGKGQRLQSPLLGTFWSLEANVEYYQNLFYAILCTGATIVY